MEDACVTQFLSTGKFESVDALVQAVERVTVDEIAETAGELCLDTVYCLTGREAD